MSNNSLRELRTKEHSGKQQKDDSKKCTGKWKAANSRIKEIET